jgi:type 1 fimbriae regulatory protein FimB
MPEKTRFCGVSRSLANFRNVKSSSQRMRKRTEQTLDSRGKDFLTEAEIDRFLDAARRGRHGVRDSLMMLMTYRHGLRVSELIDLRLKDLDLDTGRLFIRRKKGSLSTHQPIEGDELRALRAWFREREQRRDARSSYLFLSERGPLTRQAVNYLVAAIGKRAKLRFHVHPHMLRDSTGYYLANRGYDTRLVQDYLGHKNITHTVKYTRTAAARLRDCGGEVNRCPRSHITTV